MKDFTNEGVYGTATAGTPTALATNFPAQTYEFRLMEYANLANLSTSTTINYRCGNMGNQFRPLKEVDKYGRVNPFQDPTRGVIPSQAAGTATAVSTGGTITANTKTRNLLISLSGKDSIIGRGIAVYNTTRTTTVSTSALRNTKPVGCCVVALDVPPTVSVNHHHHYGYGGYGHGGYSSPSYSSGHGSYSAPSHGHSSGHGHGYGSSHGYTTAANTSNSTHKHDYGHGNGIGSHSHSGSGHGGSGYGGYSTGSHTHGTTTHTHEVGAPKVTAKPNDFFGGSKSGSSYFSNMAYQPSSRYSSRRY